MRLIRGSLQLAALVAVFATVFAYDPVRGARAAWIASSALAMVLLVLPPILVGVALLEAWLPQETIVRWMGPESGARGVLVVLVLGALSAGPLYLAFPLARTLARSGVRYALALFLLGAWSSTKLTVVVFQLQALGARFTLTHIAVSLLVHLAGALVIEKLATDADLERLAGGPREPL